MLVAAMILAIEEAPEGGRELPMPPLAFGLMAFCFLLGLLALTFAFRSVGKRH